MISPARPPFVPGLPLIGSALEMLPDPCAFFVRSYRRFGPVFRLGILNRTVTVLAGPAANLFFAKHGDRYLSSKEPMATLCHELGTDDYLPALDGSAHRHLRKTLKPGFSREAISAMLPRMAAQVERAVRSWPVGHRFAVLPTMQRLVVEQTALAMANTTTDCLDDAVTFGNTLIGVGVAMQPRLLLARPRYRSAKHRLHRFLDRVIDAHRTLAPGSQRQPDLIDTALTATHEDGRPLDAAALHAITHAPWVNGALYPSRACGFVLYELLAHPEVLQRVTDEIDAAFAGGVPDAAAIRRLRWLRGAVLESLRLHPIMFALPRRVAEPFEFAGFRLDAGTGVMVAIGVSHFLPQLFPQPERFDVERYSAPRNEHCQTGALTPFGLGAHACISAGAVEAVVMVTIATLLRHVRLVLDPPGYTLRTALNPVPGPPASFRLRVGAQRTAPAVHVTVPVRAETDIADILPDLNQQQLAAAIATLQRHTYAAGTTIIREGDMADRFYVLTKGEVDVLKRRADGTSQVVARLRSGQCFGEIGIIQGLRRTASVRATDGTAVEALSLDGETFLDLVRESDLTGTEIARLVRRRTIATSVAVALPTLGPERSAQLTEHLDRLSYAPGSTIIRQGEPADRFFIIVDGRVDVLNQHPSGREIHVGSLGAGDYFGEVGLLRQRPRTATVRAACDATVELLALDAAAFRQLVADSPQTAEELTLVMCERLLDLARKTQAASTG